MRPVVRHNRRAVWTPRIACKQVTCMRIRKDGAVEALVEPGLIENPRLEIFSVRRYIGLPTQTWNDGQVGIGLPRILEVHAHIALAGVPPHKGLLPVLRRLSQQAIA